MHGLILIALVGIALSDDPGSRPTPAQARAACEASGRADCDELTSWFEPLPAPEQSDALETACEGGDGEAC